MNKTIEYLKLFKPQATEWFARATFVREYYSFFQNFFQRENLEKAEWSDIQEIGDHLHCFQSVALARSKALGKANHPIDHYRKSFLFLAHGPGEPADRIRKFSREPEYRLNNFGRAAISEIVGYLFPEQFMFVNARDKFAAEFLGFPVQKSRGGDLVAELEAFSQATRPIARLYEEIVGRQTDLPINLEVDQFFSWVYENYSPGPQPPPPPPNPTPSDFAKLLRRYYDERIVFSSSVHQVRYAVTAWDDAGVKVERLDANEPQRVTFSQAQKLLQRLENSRTLDFTSWDDTSAVRNTVLQAEAVSLTADRQQVTFVEQLENRLQNLLVILDNLNLQNPLYKPAMLLCVLDGIDDGSLPDNRITFDWIAPRFISKMAGLGQDVTEEQAAQPFYHLANEVIWLHAVADLKNLMTSGRDGAKAAREKIKYALLKDTYWNLLQEPFYRSVVRSKLILMTSYPAMIQRLLPAAEGAITETGFVAAPGQITRFISALAAKPFVILTGNSGTGKTKLAELFSEWLCGRDSSRFALVPVGADWTDNRNVLGFVNHMRQSTGNGDGLEAGLPIYQSTKILDLLLEAKARPAQPFFLILDEMNLSHVERYFADFLSTMESSDGGLLLHREGVKLPRRPNAPPDVPETLHLPRNLFVIGTVNVDETTYMFSPKVLDRANVVEFRTGKSSPTAFLSRGGKPLLSIVPATDGMSEVFLQLSCRARSLDNAPGLPLIADPEQPPAGTEDAIKHAHATISNIYSLMEQRNQEFGFRTMAEILRYLAVDHELCATRDTWQWKPAMDAQIIQKILPKLHGSRKRIEDLLIELAQFCETGELSPKTTTVRSRFDLQPVTRVRGPVSENGVESQEPDPVTFRRSYEKLCDMIDAVRRDQFVSFIQ